MYIVRQHHHHHRHHKHHPWALFGLIFRFILLLLFVFWMSIYPMLLPAGYFSLIILNIFLGLLRFSLRLCKAILTCAKDDFFVMCFCVSFRFHFNFYSILLSFCFFCTPLTCNSHEFLWFFFSSNPFYSSLLCSWFSSKMQNVTQIHFVRGEVKFVCLFPHRLPSQHYNDRRLNDVIPMSNACNNTNW